MASRFNYKTFQVLVDIARTKEPLRSMLQEVLVKGTAVDVAATRPGFTRRAIQAGIAKLEDLHAKISTAFSEKAPLVHPVILNQRLITQQGLSAQEVSTIEGLHSVRQAIELDMLATKDPVELKRLFKQWTTNQFELQDAWHFPRDARYHRSWYLPHCSCAKVANDDNYPTGIYSRESDCPIHG